MNEAMACARPVIVSDRVGCAPDLIDPGVNGWIVPAGEVTALRDSMAYFLDHPEQISQMGRVSAEKIAAWDIDQAASRIEAAVAEAVTAFSTTA